MRKKYVWGEKKKSNSDKVSTFLFIIGLVCVFLSIWWYPYNNQFFWSGVFFIIIYVLIAVADNESEKKKEKEKEKKKDV